MAVCGGASIVFVNKQPSLMVRAAYSTLCKSEY